MRFRCTWPSLTIIIHTICIFPHLCNASRRFALFRNLWFFEYRAFFLAVCFCLPNSVCSFQKLKPSPTLSQLFRAFWIFRCTCLNLCGDQFICGHQRNHVDHFRVNLTSESSRNVSEKKSVERTNASTRFHIALCMWRSMADWLMDYCALHFVVPPPTPILWLYCIMDRLHFCYTLLFCF